MRELIKESRHLYYDAMPGSRFIYIPVPYRISFARSVFDLCAECGIKHQYNYVGNDAACRQTSLVIRANLEEELMEYEEKSVKNACDLYVKQKHQVYRDLDSAFGPPT